MPLFKVQIHREYSIIEGFDRYVEAPDEEAAREIAVRVAHDSDDDSPDDCSEVNGDGASSYWVEHVEPTTDTPPADDIIKEDE